MRAASIPGRVAFGSEIAAARKLGFRLQVNVGETSVAARAIPDTDRARVAVRRAHGQDAHIEAVAASTDGDALRDCVRSVLERAREIS